MSQVKRALDKLAVHSEPGLTTAQLMLVNDDLKPGTNTVYPTIAYYTFYLADTL